MNKITWNILNNDSCAYFILYASRYVKEQKLLSLVFNSRLAIDSLDLY